MIGGKIARSVPSVRTAVVDSQSLVIALDTNLAGLIQTIPKLLQWNERINAINCISK